MAITSCTRLALLVFASVAMLGQLTTADVCSKSMGPCGGIDCNAVCLAQFSGSKGECDQSNLCTCFFDCSKQKYCNDGLGPCGAECRDDCCAQKCASKYDGGIGYCESPVFPYNLCQCKFPCE